MKTYELTVESIEKVGEDYYVFNFHKPDDFIFEEGQYGVFKHVEKDFEGRKMRAFSIASAKHESFVKAATKIVEAPSGFKDVMRKLSVGETMTFTGPMGTFTLEPNYHSVFIAGGIGITPIRSILMSLQDKGYHNDAALIYSEPRSVYPFQEDFTMVQATIYYESTIDGTRNAISDRALKYQNSAYYYIAGSSGFVSAITEQLLELGIEKSKIKFDRFPGYQEE